MCVIDWLDLLSLRRCCTCARAVSDPCVSLGPLRAALGAVDGGLRSGAPPAGWSGAWGCMDGAAAGRLEDGLRPRPGLHQLLQRTDRHQQVSRLVHRRCRCCSDTYIFLEIDRYIGLPIFFPIFKHFTIIGYRFCQFLFYFCTFFFCHIHNYTEYNQQWNVFSVFDPSKYTHTPGAVDTHTHTHSHTHSHTHTHTHTHTHLEQ